MPLRDQRGFADARLAFDEHRGSGGRIEQRVELRELALASVQVGAFERSQRDRAVGLFTDQQDRRVQRLGPRRRAHAQIVRQQLAGGRVASQRRSGAAGIGMGPHQEAQRVFVVGIVRQRFLGVNRSFERLAAAEQRFGTDETNAGQQPFESNASRSTHSPSSLANNGPRTNCNAASAAALAPAKPPARRRVVVSWARASNSTMSSQSACSAYPASAWRSRSAPITVRRRLTSTAT